MTKKLSVSHERFPLKRVLAGLALLAGLAGAYLLLEETGALKVLCDCDALLERITGPGVPGPLAVILLMATAVVISPIPSAPIALAAGLAYGHFWGTLYIVAGAETGAIIAFFIARLAGYEVLRRWLGDRMETGLLGSQNTLTFLVFIGRLVPFISFDILSYAAGLTPIRFWRFALATLAGILPVSFALAHFGQEMSTGSLRKTLVSVFFIGAVTLIPPALKWFLQRRRSETRKVGEGHEEKYGGGAVRRTGKIGGRWVPVEKKKGN